MKRQDGLCGECAEGDHRHHRPHMGGICIGCPCEFHAPLRSRVKVRVHVTISGWIELEGEFPGRFDLERRNAPHSAERRFCDRLEDKALSEAAERLDGECDDFVIIEIK